MKKIAKGFTLVELMIVVAIIGILAAIAIPNFIKYQLRSKFSEASSNIEGLRKAEEALSQGERKVVISGAVDLEYLPGTYHSLGKALMPALNAVPGTAKVAWDTTDLEAAQGIDWSIEGATYFNYQVETGACASTAAGGGNSASCYSIGAAANIDGTGANGEVALVKRTIDNATQSAMPSNVGAFPGTEGSCLDKNSATVYGMPCTITGPDVF